MIFEKIAFTIGKKELIPPRNANPLLFARICSVPAFYVWILDPAFLSKVEPLGRASCRGFHLLPARQTLGIRSKSREPQADQPISPSAHTPRPCFLQRAHQPGQNRVRRHTELREEP